MEDKLNITLSLRGPILSDGKEAFVSFPPELCNLIIEFIKSMNFRTVLNCAQVNHEFNIEFSQPELWLVIANRLNLRVKDEQKAKEKVGHRIRTIRKLIIESYQTWGLCINIYDTFHTKKFEDLTEQDFISMNRRKKGYLTKRKGTTFYYPQPWLHNGEEIHSGIGFD